MAIRSDSPYVPPESVATGQELLKGHSNQTGIGATQEDAAAANAVTSALRTSLKGKTPEAETDQLAKQILIQGALTAQGAAVSPIQIGEHSILVLKRAEGREELGRGQFATVEKCQVVVSAVLNGTSELIHTLEFARKVPTEEQKSKESIVHEVAIYEGLKGSQVALDHVVHAYTVNEDGLLLEHMDQTLLQRIESSPPSGEEAKQIVTELMQGIGEIHQAGYVHGDITAGNCMFAKDGKVKVCDMGCAQKAGEANRRPVNYSIASPNQLSGLMFNAPARREKADDLFAMGVLLYQLAAGTRPSFISGDRVAGINFDVEKRNELLNQIHQLPPDEQEKIFTGRGQVANENEPLAQNYRDLTESLARKYDEFRQDLATFLQPTPESELGKLAQDMMQNSEMTMEEAIGRLKEIPPDTFQFQPLEGPLMQTSGYGALPDAPSHTDLGITAAQFSPVEELFSKSDAEFEASIRKLEKAGVDLGQWKDKNGHTLLDLCAMKVGLSANKAKFIFTHFHSNTMKALLKNSDLNNPDVIRFIALTVANNPVLATKVHHLLRDIAVRLIERGETVAAFRLMSKAASLIPISENNPLHNMDKAILEATKPQENGAYFSNRDTSIVKCGTLHATQRNIDGALTNSFDFKISHYARDELTACVAAITDNQQTFKDSLPPGLCTDVVIKQDQPQGYIGFNEATSTYERANSYNLAKATEIEFVGAGKVIISETKHNGCLYNWIQVEMDANLPPGVGVERLHQMLAVLGLGPVVGDQPEEANERMKIAQIFRAFCPREATAFDQTREFYELPLEQLKSEICRRAPAMKEKFVKYLETNPELMRTEEIMPGQKIWGVADFGEELKKAGAWGFFTGVGNSGPDTWVSAKDALVRILTEGAMASEQRFKTGMFTQGASSGPDLVAGGGDQVFTRMMNESLAGRQDSRVLDTFRYAGEAQILWDVHAASSRVPYGHRHDVFGSKNRDQPELYHGRPSLEEMAADQALSVGNEVMFKNNLNVSHMAGIMVGSLERKKELIEHLKSEGIAKEIEGVLYIGNKPAEDFIRVGAKFTKDMWG